MAILENGSTVGGYLITTSQNIKQALKDGGGLDSPTITNTTTMTSGRATLVNFDDVNKYLLATGVNWGLYWETGANKMSWRGAGVDTWTVNLSTGDTWQKGLLQVSNKAFITQWGSGVPVITLALGDNDSGFHAPKDGVTEYWSNNVKRYNMTDVYHTGRKPTKTDVGLSNVPNYTISSAVNDTSNSKFATAGAVKQAYDRGTDGINRANNAQTKANSAYSLASGKMTQATGDGRYVNLTGDTMTGRLTMTGNSGIDWKPTITSNMARGANYYNASGIMLGCTGAQWTGSSKELTNYYFGSGAGAPWNDAEAWLSIRKDGLVLIKGKRVYHQGFKPTKTDVGLSNVPNYIITSAVNDSSNSKFATAGAVKQAYDRGTDGINRANNAQNTANALKTVTDSFALIGDSSKFVLVKFPLSNGRSDRVVIWREYSESIGAPDKGWNAGDTTHFGSMTLDMCGHGATWGGSCAHLSIQASQQYTNSIAQVSIGSNGDYVINVYLRPSAKGVVYHYSYPTWDDSPKAVITTTTTTTAVAPYNALGSITNTIYGIDYSNGRRILTENSSAQLGGNDLNFEGDGAVAGDVVWYNKGVQQARIWNTSPNALALSAGASTSSASGGVLTLTVGARPRWDNGELAFKSDLTPEDHTANATWYYPTWWNGTTQMFTSKSKLMFRPSDGRFKAITFECGNWFRSTGTSGWFNDTYGGGIFMQDTSWIRTYGNKKFFVENKSSDAIYTAGGITADAGVIYNAQHLTGKSVDLNNYIRTSNYNIYSSVSLKNTGGLGPRFGYGTLQVIGSNNSSANFVTQTVIERAGTVMAFRGRNDGAANWSEWSEVYHTKYKPTKTDVGLSNVPNYIITSAVNDTSNSKFATAGAVKQAYDRGTDGINRANNADNIAGKYSEFTVGGDANKFYPVVITIDASTFGMKRVSISRGYNWTGPAWNTASHKGGCTATFDWSGDGTWGGNEHLANIVTWSYQYAYCVGGLQLSTSGMVIWLRGGGAMYRLSGDCGSHGRAEVHLTDWLDAGKIKFAVKSLTEAVKDFNSLNLLSIATNIDRLFPVGHILITTNPANPKTYGYSGTWVLLDDDISLVSTKTASAANKITGTNTPAVPLPAHGHTATAAGVNLNGNFISDSTGVHSHAQTVYTANDLNNDFGHYPVGTDDIYGRYKSAIRVDDDGAHTHHTQVNFGTHAHGVAVHSSGTANAVIDVRGRHLSVYMYTRTA